MRKTNRPFFFLWLKISFEYFRDRSWASCILRTVHEWIFEGTSASFTLLCIRAFREYGKPVDYSHSAGIFVEKFLFFFFPSFRRGLYMGKNLSDFFKKTGKIVDSYIWRLQDIRMICRFLFSGFSGNKIVTLESKSIADISDVIGSKNFSMGGQKISNKRIRRYRVSNFFFLRSR